MSQNDARSEETKHGPKGLEDRSIDNAEEEEEVSFSSLLLLL